MIELCPNCLKEMVEIHNYHEDKPGYYCPICGEVVYMWEGV